MKTSGGYGENLRFFTLIGRNSLLLFAVNILPMLSTFVIGVLLSRASGAAAFGEYSAAYTFYNLFYFLPLLGLGALIIRDLSTDRKMAGKYFANMGLISLAVSAVCMALIHLLASVFDYAPAVRSSAFIAGWAIFPNALILIAQALFVALGRVRYAFAVAVIETGVKLFISIAVVSSGSGVGQLMAAQVFSKMLGAAVSVYLVARSVRDFRARLDLAFCGDLWKQAAEVFLLITMLNNIFTKVDLLVLSAVRRIEEVGQYSSASKLVWFGYLFLGAVTTALLPLVCRLYVSSRETFGTHARRILKYIAGLLLPLLLAGSLFAGSLITAIFNARFAASEPVFRVLVWSVFFYGIYGFCDVMLIAAGRQKQIIYTLGFSLALSLALNIRLASGFGGIGSAAAVLISMAVFACLELFLVSRFVDLRLPATLGGPALGLAAAGMVIYFTRGNLNTPLTACLSLAAYLLTLFAARAITEEGKAGIA